MRKTTWGSLRLRLPDRASSMGDDSAAVSRLSTDGADSVASSTTDHPSTEPSDPHPSQCPHASIPFNSSASHQSSANFPDTGLGQPNSPRENNSGRPSRVFRRQLTGPRSSAPSTAEALPDGPPPVHDFSRASAYPMQPPPRMASIPESPRAALPSAEELRQSNFSANAQPPPLSKPSAGFIQQPGPGRGAGFARASAPARGPHGGPTPASPWSTQTGGPDLHGQAAAGQHATAHPPPIRIHGPTPAVSSSYGTDPPMATVSLVNAPGNPAIRAGPLGSPRMSSTPLSQPAFGTLYGGGQFARQPLQGPHAAGTRPVQFQAAAGAEKPGRGVKGEAGPSSAGAASGGSSSEHLRAIGLLCQAAAITGTSSSLSNQHLRSMRMLCQAYLSGELHRTKHEF